tara:strand:- start:18 stop:404 length:387 start_codon:yes stop_codon:yes gene_type:complete
MELLSSIHTMSIAELRKVLQDNNVVETASSKEDLQQQVGETLLSNMMMQEMMENDVPEVGEQPKIPQKDPRTLEREQQDKEYQQALFFDERGKYIIKQPQQMDQFTEEPIFEELSPQSLRKKRMQYYQ